MSKNTAIVLSVAVVAVIGITGLALWSATVNQPAITFDPGTTPEIPSTGDEGSQPNSAPTVDTTSASSVTGSSATLNGQVSPNGGRTVYWFEYGTDIILGNIMGSTGRTELASTGTTSQSASANVAGLNPDTRYFYRLVAQNSAGTARGDIIEFRTLQQQPPSGQQPQY